MKKAPRGAELIGRCLFHDQKLNEDGYNYYGYLSRQGDYFIMREKTDESEIRFAYDETRTYQEAFIARATLDYKYINEF